MRVLLAAVIILCFIEAASAQTPSEEKQVRQAVQLFYDAFNSHGFGRVEEFTTEDWSHINPMGGWTRGREAVLKELKEVHSTFLKGVTDTPEEMAVRFATPDVAVVTVPSRTSTFTTPDGVKHENERQIRTFVVVKRGGRWLIMQDQNTFSAQSREPAKYDSNDPATWPAALDATVAAPQNHKVVLENERVRVLEVTVQPGEREPVHGHKWPSVMYVMAEDLIRDYDRDGKLLYDSSTDKARMKTPYTIWMPPQAPHSVENLSKTPVRLLRVELKQ